MTHFVSETCKGEHCGMCYRQGQRREATHKVGEEIPEGYPGLAKFLDGSVIINPHPLAQYVCCQHFAEIMSAASVTKFRACEVPL